MPTASAEDVEFKNLGMACRCKPERAKKYDTLQQEALIAIWGDRAEGKSLVTAIIHDLSHEFTRSFQLKHSWADQWLAVTVTSNDFDVTTHEFTEKIRITIQCDVFEDGLAQIWQYINNTYERYDDNK